MAYFLFRLIRKKIGENKVEKTAVPTTNESNLIPEISPGHDQQQNLQKTQKYNHVNTGSPIDSCSAEDAARAKQESHRRRIRQFKLMLGLILPNFLAAMDVTIVATAIPLISSQFNRLSGSFNWIVAAYTLTFTAFVPASGQLAEIYGLHFALQFEIFWIMIGSVLCAAAQTWGMLLLGRAVQGLGAAGIMSLSRIILSDGATLAENSRSNSILSLISGISFTIGPIIGGYIAKSNWRYIFVLPVCVAFISMILIFFLMRNELVRGRASTATGEPRRLGYVRGLKIIDWPGMIMFTLGIGSIILAVQWGGTEYAWSSIATIVPFIVGGGLCITFFIYEYLLGSGRLAARIFPQQVPMIPSILFRKKDTSLLMVINFSAGISLVSGFYFISYYFQLVEGVSPSQAGTQLLYYTSGLGVGIYSAMFMCNVWPRQTFFPLVWSSIIEGVGLSLLTYSISIRNRALVKAFLAVAGAGTGLRFMPVVLHAAGINPTRITNMQSLLGFMFPLGETIGISMMGAVFTNKLSIYLSSLAKANPGYSIPPNGPQHLNTLNDLAPDAKNDVQKAAARAVTWALVSVLPFVGLSIIASFLLGNVWIRKDEKKAKNDEPGHEARSGKVMYDYYLLALLTGRIATCRQDLEVSLGDENEKKGGKPQDVEASGALAQSSERHI